MKTLLSILVIVFLVGACSSSSGVRRDPIRDCPVGMVLICETRRDQEPGSGADEEIPQYEFCYCEDVM